MKAIFANGIGNKINVVDYFQHFDKMTEINFRLKRNTELQNRTKDKQEKTSIPFFLLKKTLSSKEMFLSN